MNTRFNPTANGKLHLGHLCLIKLNEQTALNSGGKFYFIFDDNQKSWVDMLGREKISGYCKSMMEDMEWMGIRVHDYVFDSREEDYIFRYAKWAGFEERDGIYTRIPNVISSDPQYPFAPWLTFYKVLVDASCSVDTVIRGDDLRGEYSLYKWFEHIFGLGDTEHYYVPRLKTHMDSEVDNVSKTAGTYKISSYREKGYSPGDIERMIASWYLVDPRRGWAFDNVKADPRMD